MARATSKAGIGQGWHKQSLRHSNARKTGHAGGRYVVYFAISKEGKRTPIYAKDLKEVKALSNLTFAGKGGRLLKYLRDSDGDGVPDSQDCDPHNPNKQGTNEQVAQNYAEGKKDSSGTMFTEGDAVYSYGHHFPIAYKQSDGTYLFNKDGYSVTTARHKSLVRRALSGKTIKEVSTEELRKAIEQGHNEKQNAPRNFQEEDRILPEKVIDISEIEYRNEKSGGHWFDKSAKRFFNSKVAKNAYVDKKGEYAYFVSSEKFDDYTNDLHEPRKFTVRKADLRTGDIDTVGDYNKIRTSLEATNKAKQLAKE